jgi:hypothetical protein
VTHPSGESARFQHSGWKEGTILSTFALIAIAFAVWLVGAVLIALALGRVFGLNQVQDEREAARRRGGHPLRHPGRAPTPFP